MKNRFYIFLLCLAITSCYISKSKPHYQYLNFRDKFKINVKSVVLKNNTLILNDTFLIAKTTGLIFESHNPKWIFDNTTQKKSSNGEIILSPELYEVEPPYIVIKEEKTNVFDLIKNNDTINFHLEEVERVAPDYFN